MAFEAIEEWMRALTGWSRQLTTMFTDVNEKTGEIRCAGRTKPARAGMEVFQSDTESFNSVIV